MDQHQQCELCMNEGKEAKSTYAHHIVPIKEGGAKLSEDNLMALCKDCHSDVHSLVGMKITLETLFGELPWEKPIITTLEGVTDTNPDGKNRQEIIAECSEGEMVKLVRYPQQDLIKVFHKAGNQIGHIDPKLARYSYLSYDMDHGCKVWARIQEITGDPSHYDLKKSYTRQEMQERWLTLWRVVTQRWQHSYLRSA
jgi:hypothetical protein